MTVLKFSIMASRAEDSQQTLVTVPTIRTYAKPPAVSRWGRSEAPWTKAEKRYFNTISSSGRTSRAG